MDDVFRELSQHLELTQINQERKINGEEPFLSSFVSLSGHFRWTAQRACKIGKTASEDQLPGLAIFDTSAIEAGGVRIWRVGDMLDFFDTFKAESSVFISPNLRCWAANADGALIETVHKVSCRRVIRRVSWRLIHQDEREVTESIPQFFYRCVSAFHQCMALKIRYPMARNDAPTGLGAMASDVHLQGQRKALLFMTAQQTTYQRRAWDAHSYLTSNPAPSLLSTDSLSTIEALDSREHPRIHRTTRRLHREHVYNPISTLSSSQLTS